MLTLPALAEAVVFGVADAQWGESGVAVLVLRDVAVPVTTDQVFEHLQTRLAKYKWPRTVQFWTDLPKSAYGKLVKKDIRDEFLRRQAVPTNFPHTKAST